MDLSYLDGKKVAVLLCTSKKRVLKGTARMGANGHEKRVFRIELDDVGPEDGNPVLFIHEDEWSGTVARDDEFGCDYRIGVCEKANAK